MKREVLIPSTLLLLFFGSGSLAGRDSTQIEIAGGSLAKSIVITDPAVLGRFKVGTGPGTFELRPDGTRLMNFAPSFVIDWSRGVVTNPPKGLQRYEVSFVTGRRDGGIYVVFYAVDSSTHQGYVYIPGARDPEYSSNTRLIFRSVEGNWFYAWNAWQQVADRLIAQALASQ